MASIVIQYIGCRPSGFRLILLSLVIGLGNVGWRSAVAQRPADGGVVWSGWLGPERDGWVRGFEAPEVWPKALKKQWRVEVGVGYGSPLVAGGAGLSACAAGGG